MTSSGSRLAMTMAGCHLTSSCLIATSPLVLFTRNGLFAGSSELRRQLSVTQMNLKEMVTTMDKLITALAPVSPAGLGIRQWGEILSPLIDKISADNKKVILGLVSLTLGPVLAFTAKLHVLQLLGVTPATGEG